MRFPRRDLLTLAGGAAAGVAFTPVPWKLLDDSAIWTQNWSWMPRVPRGEIATRYTTCTLCPAGCAVRARCVAGRPFSLAGAAGDALCPAGLCAHHAMYLPKPAGEAKLPPLDETAAILDLRPGRTASRIYRSLPVRYYTAPLAEGATLAAMSRMAGCSLHFDLARVRTLVSIATPVLEGWGSPARVWRRKAEGMRVVQVESRASRTAMAADRWIAVEPGSELDFLQGKLDAEGPALVVADGAGLPQAVVDAAAQLNFTLGGDAIVAGREAFVETPSIAGAPDGSIGLLVVDESSAVCTAPWPSIERKLRPGAGVVAFTSVTHGVARHARHIVPAPAYLEAFDDAPTAVDSPVETFRVSTPLAPAPQGVALPAELIARAAGVDIVLEAELKKRAEAIQNEGRGELLDYAGGGRKPARGEDIWKAVSEGAAWLDEPLPARKWTPKAAPPGLPAQRAGGRLPLTLLAVAWRGDGALPMLRKLDREADVRPRLGEVRLHPETAARYGVRDGGEARVTTACGSCRLRVRVDAAVPPQALEAACGPNLADLCETGAGAPARIETV